MKRLFFLLVLGCLGAYFIRTFFFEGIYLASDSMAPTFPTGTHVMVNKFAFLFRQPRRGEVVEFHTPQQPGKGLVKRIIAVEGDTLEIRAKKVYVNGVLLKEPYVQNLKPHDIFKGDNTPLISVPTGFVVMMGDNRDVSGDSRDWRDPNGTWSPFVSIESIEGLVGEAP